MKTMTFSGRTMREAIALAKARFGAEVDILDSGAVGDEVQVTVVVPMARSARRRQALAQVSASINALAAKTAAQATATVPSSVTVPSSASALSPAAVADTGETALQGRAARGTKGRRKRQADAGTTTSTQVTEETVAMATQAVAPSMPAAPVADYLVAAASSVTLAAANDEMVSEPVGAPAPATESVRAAGSQHGGLAAAANDSPVQPQTVELPGVTSTPGQPSRPAGTLPDIAAGMPLSTLDFQRVREQQRAEQAPAVTVPVAGAAPAVGVPDFAALLEQQRQGIPIDLSALQMPGQGAGATVMKQPFSAPVAGAQPSGVGGKAPAILRGDAGNAAAAAAHAARQPRSRLWQMVDSARRMLGMGRLRRRALWNDVDAALMSQAAAAQASGAAAARPGSMPDASGAQAGPVQTGVAMTGFGEASPLSLASTLAGGLGDWPSITLPSDLSGAGELPAGQAGWTGHDGPGWFEVTRRRPGQMRLLRNLLGCQFSPALARTLVELLPADYAEAQADEWLRQMLMRALASVNRGAGQVVEGERTLFDEGGVFALIGPTGVGKTTSIAKIAAHHVLRHGPRSLALITADVYRIGAQEQLRAFGRMLGVPVQVAQDRDVLQQLLKEHEQSRLVLIDTAGIGQRDDRVSQLTSALEVSQVRRVLVMNAAAQPGSIEEVLGAFGARDTAGVLLSKVDEAVGLGACLDALVRHRLPLLGYADGQRVPEDYHAVDFSRLVGLALDRKTVSRFTALKMTDSEMRNLFEDAHV